MTSGARDAAGFVEVASLKGIHYAMKSGLEAGRAIFRALKAGDCSAAGLAGYDEAVERAIRRTDPFPRKRDGTVDRTVIIRFRPVDAQ